MYITLDIYVHIYNLPGLTQFTKEFVNTKYYHKSTRLMKVT